MKYVVLLGDGMADEPLKEFGGKTPLELASTPRMDALAQTGQLGRVETVPQGYPPGSDVANLSVFGYDPAQCYSGRAPLEAASMGVELGPDDVAFRLNLVNLMHNYGKIYMNDFTAGHISTEESARIIQTLQDELGGEEFNFYPGVSYRHLLVWKGGKDKLTFTPPHDLTYKPIEDHFPKGQGAEELVSLTTSAQMLLNDHPVNRQRDKEGKTTANSIWLWGHGKAPKMETMQEKFGLSGAVISAVDLIKGIGRYAGLESIEVPGATGYIDTNYQGKAEAALDVLKEKDFVYVHVEAPDEAAHAGSLEDKIKAIEDFDAKIVGPVVDGLSKLGDYRLLVLPDHPTPVSKMTHTSEAVPYILAGLGLEVSDAEHGAAYSEREAQKTGLLVPRGHQLLEKTIRDNS